MTAVVLEETARAQQMFILGQFMSAEEAYSAVYSSAAHTMWKGQLRFNTLMFSALKCSYYVDYVGIPVRVRSLAPLQSVNYTGVRFTNHWDLVLITSHRC